MPYYLYQVKPFGQLEKLAEFESFRSASIRAKAIRAETPAAALGKIKVMFAESALQAEDLLCQVRTAGPAGDD